MSREILVDWDKIDVEELDTAEDWNDLISSLQELGLTKKKFRNKYRRAQYDFIEHYEVEYIQDTYASVRYWDEESGKFRCKSLFFNDMSQGTTGAGRKALQYHNDKLREKCGKDVTMFQIFSAKKYRDEYRAIKNCVCSPMDYARPSVKKRQINICKADVSAAYPTELCKTLPTLHDCKKYKGRIEPTDEYPFAFYTKSGHVKIKGELYTRDFAKSAYYPYDVISKRKWHPNDNISAAEDETILCKAVDKVYQDAIIEIEKELYAGRKEMADNKLIMNSFIGYLHKNSNPFASPVAAVVMARCANNMIKRCEKLEETHNWPVLVNTDSISWTGDVPEWIAKDKKMGNFVLEEVNVPMLIVSVKAYQYLHNDVECITKYSGIKKEITQAMEFGQILSVTHVQTFFVFDEETDKLVEVNQYGEKL